MHALPPTSITHSISFPTSNPYIYHNWSPLTIPFHSLLPYPFTTTHPYTILHHNPLSTSKERRKRTSYYKMPSLLEDPTTHIPAPTPTPSLQPISRTLRDGTKITLYPITTGPDALPSSLIHYLHKEFSSEILKGCTYPMEAPLEYDLYRTYWFGTFAVVAVIDDGGDGLREGRDWERDCLGTFYVKPNYPGISLSL